MRDSKGPFVQRAIVAIPAYNEAENLPLLVLRVLEQGLGPACRAGIRRALDLGADAAAERIASAALGWSQRFDWNLAADEMALKIDPARVGS